MPKVIQNAAPGSVLQSVYAEFATELSVGAIPADDTIPQISEGTQVLTASITPLFSTSKLRVRAQAAISEESNVGDYLSIAIFRDSATDAIGASWANTLNSTSTLNTGTVCAEAASTTFSLRAGNNSGTARLNGKPGGGRLFGGAQKTTLVVEEIAT